ncbi:MFS transporter [Clostridium sp. 19966]|uniref:MFS transporter n=1 Tax=Clostridium sp. 19966 TaxID=2768166 RepID=UPI0028E46BE0|nr:MFS transporter [Clostridium sp. 19966]
MKSLKGIINKNFHALTHSNFKYYWLGQCVSLMGTWMQSIGQSWLVLQLTNSSFLLGIVSAMQFLPFMFLSPFAGVIIDKFSKKKIIIITQVTSMLLALILSLLVFTGTVKYWEVLILALILGIVNTLDNPARQSFIVELVGKKDLMNAISLNSATFNLARIIGPAFGAMLISYLGISWCFMLNGLSFIAVLIGLIRIDVPYKKEVKTEKTNMLGEIKDGFSYVRSESSIIEVLIFIFIMGIFAYNFNVLIPVYTVHILKMDAQSYGFLLSALGAGSLAGAMLTSFKSKKGPNMNIIRTSPIIVGALLTILGISRNYYALICLLFVTGIFNIFFSTTANTSLQHKTKDEYRGRVMSIYSLVFIGSSPIGSFLSGLFSDKLGADIAFAINGTLLALIIIMIRIKFYIMNKK